MPRFLVAIHHRNDFDPSAHEDDAIRNDIDALNDEMIAAGVRVFVGGLHRAHKAKSLTSEGEVIVMRDGPYIKATEHVAGFWVLEVPNEEEALAWGRKAVRACRAPVEVRQFH